MIKPDGGPAFPFAEKNDDGSHHLSHAGMTLRDWFAGQVIGKIISIDDVKFPKWMENNAKAAYAQADAMIAERNK